MNVNVSVNGFAQCSTLLEDEFIPSRPGLSPSECRKIHADLLNYMSHRITKLTQLEWPWGDDGEPLKNKIDNSAQEA